MKCLNLFGGPSSGKTTTAHGLIHFMNIKGYDTEFVPEYAKLLYWANRLEKLQDQQEYIFAKQNHMLHNLRNKVDYAIVDSPVLLSYCYTSQSERPWPARDAFKAFVIASFCTYNNINILMDRPNRYQEVGRLQTLEEAKVIDDNIVRTLHMLGIPFIKVKADDKTIETILSYI